MKRSISVILSVLAFSVVLMIGNVPGTASGPGTFFPGSALPSSHPRARAKQETAREISESALRQIQALLAEKQTRSASQQKIDSQLLYAIKLRRGESIAPGVPTLAIDVGADDAGLVTIDVTALIDEHLLKQFAAIGVKVWNVFPRYNSLRAIAALDQLETIASFSQVRFIQPKQEAMYSQAPAQTGDQIYPPPLSQDFSSRGSRVRAEFERLAAPYSPDAPLSIGVVTSEGDTTHKVFSARGTFNTDGSGVKIGVLSNGVANLASSQATGDLGPVTILPGQGGSGDEGTAMLEIIHDLAPGAQLYFATGGNGIASFAQNIRDLRSAGCDIILDDIGYFVESAFQDGQAPGVISTNNGGVVTQAVNDVVASGALYFSSAANSGNKNDGTAGTWEGDFADGSTLGLTPGGTVHDFDPSPAVSQSDTITSSGGPINLHWSDSLGGSGNDYDLFVLNSTGTTVLASGTNIQSGTQDPYEQVSSSVDITNNRVVILQKSGAANRFLHVATNRGRLSFSTPGDTHGHNAASGAYGVAAVCAVCTFPSVFSSTNTIETFSSDGPRHIFFNGNSTAITPGDFSATGGTTLQKPDITAADGASVTGAGGFPSPFFGTSAAAPHAAAIAALLKSANPALTQAQIKTALTSTAIDIEGPGTDRDSGAGIIMPYPALQSLGAPVTGKAFLELSTISQTENGGNGDGKIDPGESGTLTITLTNTGLLNATGLNATLTTSTAGVSITGASSSYPDLGASGGAAPNATPFSITLSSSMPADVTMNFTLTVSYSGGHQPSQAYDFDLHSGINGSFETGDFRGWNVSTASTGGTGNPFHAWTVSPSGAGGYTGFNITTTSPQAGSFDAWNGFDGGGPMEYRMYQDITIPNSMVFLTWKDRAQWNFCCGATFPRTYDVQVRNPATNAVLSSLYSFSTGTTSGYHDTGWLTHNVELSSYAGQTVRLYFLQSIPETSTGPGQIEFDGISIINGTTPSPSPTPSPTPSPSPSPSPTPTPTPNGTIVISQIYAGGGTPGATYRNSFLEIFNRGSSAVDLNQWRFNFASDTGSFGTSFGFSSTQGLFIQPGQHKLIQLGSSGSGGVPLPAPDFDTFGFVDIGLSGKIAITRPGTSLSAGTCPLPNAGISDLVGFGSTANCSEGSGPTATLTNTTAAIRKSAGCTDTDDNANDFSISSPVPRNGSSGLNLCIGRLEFSQSNYNAGEGDGSVTITVNRIGETTFAATVDFASSDGSATQKGDYEVASGTLSFASGEATKTFKVLIVDDAFIEGNEILNLKLSNPTNAVLFNPSDTATVTIVNNDSAGATSPVTKQFVANLIGADEVPATPNAVKGNGGIVQLSADEASAKVSLLFSGLTGSESGAQIHGPAAAGSNAAMLFGLPLGNPLVDVVINPTAPQVTDLKARMHYMKLLSSGFPNGEIRGQLQWNPVEEADFFVRQAYFDFLGRTPDPGGFTFWTNEITQCQSNVQCLRNKRVDVSNAFFYEQEFQQTAAYVYRLYRAAYGNNQPFPNPNPDAMFPNEEKKLPSYAVFVADRARVIGGANLAQQQLTLANAFVLRSEFQTKYPTSLSTAAQFVDAVLLTLQNDLGVNLAGQRTNLINLYNTQGGRGVVMYRLSDDNIVTNPIANQPLIDAEYNRSFVLGQYFGYLRRNPDIAGFRFWLDQVNGALLRDVPKQHAMVCSFITSGEFQFRFGPVASRNNNECPQ